MGFLQACICLCPFGGWWDNGTAGDPLRALETFLEFPLAPISKGSTYCWSALKSIPAAYRQNKEMSVLCPAEFLFLQPSFLFFLTGLFNF